MTLSMLNVSIVVLSDGNNPKLLNHDFLARNSSESSSGIVFSGNFHHNFEPDADQARGEYISEIKDCEDRFMDYLKSLPIDQG